MKKICIVTGTRAEYGLLRPLIFRIFHDEELELQFVVTGAHLCPDFGFTLHEIEKDPFLIDARIEILLSTDTPTGVIKSMGMAMINFADYFSNRRPDLLIVLGDRFEMFAVTAAAAVQMIPVAHLYGGDATEGQIDEFIRHSITKMSYLHFVSNEEPRKRVIQLGEQPDRVFNVGALSVENALHLDVIEEQTLRRDMNIPPQKPYAVVTFHPVTLEESSAQSQLKQLLSALNAFPEMHFIITKANADSGGRSINKEYEKFIHQHGNCALYDSLGVQTYLSALKYARMVIGNSSSGLYEAPAFHLPTINIGDRQRGRVKADSVIDCEPLVGDIIAAIRKAMSSEFREIAGAANNPYGDGHTSEKIHAIIKEHLFHKGFDLKKSFYAIEVLAPCE